jgi:hypothetical protein
MTIAAGRAGHVLGRVEESGGARDAVSPAHHLGQLSFGTGTKAEGHEAGAVLMPLRMPLRLMLKSCFGGATRESPTRLVTRNLGCHVCRIAITWLHFKTLSIA